MIKPLLITLTAFTLLAAGEKGTIYLTFDDGPINATTGVLEVLHKEEIKGSFFINAFHLYGEGDENEDKSLESLKQILHEGHLVANHSYDHMLHNCTDGTRSGAAYCNEVGKWPVKAFGDPMKEIVYFPMNREKLEAKLPEAVEYKNYQMDKIYRMPYTNSWRVSRSLQGDALCATSDSLVPWDANYECDPKNPSESVKNGITILNMLTAAGKQAFGWDVDWGPSDWGAEFPTESMTDPKKLLEEVEEAMAGCAPRELTPDNSKCHTLNCESRDRQGKVVILTHDFLFENGHRGKGGDINLPKLEKFIRLAKKAGYRFDTIDNYLR